MKKLLALLPLFILAYVIRPWFFGSAHVSANTEVGQVFQVMLGLVVVSVILLVMFARSKFQK